MTNNMTSLEEKIASLPTQPGVYRFFDKDGEVIYVGKARQLVRRVKQYFSKSAKEAKVMAMMEHVVDLAYTITETESDAFILEATQIKHYKPRYNIILRDDKSYPYLLLTKNEAFPRFDFIRSPRKKTFKGNRLYGPYPSLGSAKDALVLLQKVFKLRNCKDSYFNNRTRPCLQYQIGRCSAPCVGNISEKNYQQEVRDLELFLSGKQDKALDGLKAKMQDAAKGHRYEHAAMIRDQIASLRSLQAQQLIAVKKEDFDVLAVARHGRTGYISMVFVREGRVMHCHEFELKIQHHTTDEDILTQFLIQYYLHDSPINRIPAKMILPMSVAQKADLESVLSDKAHHKVTFKTLLNAQDKHYMVMAERNVKQHIQRKLQTNKVIEDRLYKLAKHLGLEQSVQQIECFDISHTQGQDARAACVVYNQKGHDKSSYRLFTMKDIIPGDDVAAIAQAVKRRYKRLLKEEKPLPTILLIDGGKTQCHAAQQSLKELEIGTILVLGISKGAARKAGMEKIILPNDGILQLNPQDTSFHLLQAVRDEAHRFGLKNHRNKRQKNTMQSVLEDIEGIGPKKRKALLSYFGGLKTLQKASAAEIARVPGINEKLAEKIRLHLIQISKVKHT